MPKPVSQPQSNVTPLRAADTTAMPATPAMAPAEIWLAWWQNWLGQWSRAARWPLGGDVIQDIAPETHWFSPTLELNIAGDPRVEADVVRNVASYGKQLGILTDAVLAAAKDSQDPAMRRLRDLAKEIEAHKEARRSDAVAAARRALDELRRRDPNALDTVLADYGGTKASARRTKPQNRPAEELIENKLM